MNARSIVIWSLLVTLGAAVLVGPVQAAPTSASLQRENRTLKTQLATQRALAALRLVASRTFETRLAARTIERDEAIAASVTSAAALGEANQQLAGVRGQLDAMTTQRDNALAGLPAAILAVPLAQFPDKVFAPARQAWPCDSLYVSGGYWSYTFDGGSFC